MLRIVTLNIGSLFEPDWDRRRHEVVAWIDRLEPDVVCLQEAWEGVDQPNTAGWIAEACRVDWRWVFGGFVVPFLARDPDDPDGPDGGPRFGSAIFSRWAIDEHHLHRLPVGPADEERADDGQAMVEAIGWELLHVRTAGLDVFSTHLTPAPTHARHRRLQVAAIDEIIRSARGEADRVDLGRRRETMPPILCGDFNAEPDSDEIRFLRGLTPLGGHDTFYQDAWSVAGDGGPGFTQDWRTHPLAATLNVHRKRIDHVFVGDAFLRAGDAGRVLRCEVVADEPLTGIQASDHRGLLVEITWPQRPSS